MQGIVGHKEDPVMNCFNYNIAAHLRWSGNGTLVSQSIEDHASGTAALAAEYAPLALKNLVATAALWHDIGKYQPAFQTYLYSIYQQSPQQEQLGSSSKKVIHAGLGAVHAARCQPDFCGCMLAFLIAGHHAGLPDWCSPTSNRGLEYTLTKCSDSYDSICSLLPPSWFKSKLPDSDLQLLLNSMASRGTALTLALRIAFSCLVDADFLDTERFMDAEQSHQRHSIQDGMPSLNVMLQILRHYMAQQFDHTPATPVNQLRAEIKQEAERGADHPDNFFSLTVPTGGGKTLASLDFALNYALKHGKKRIIYAIPYTSIIEQTADTFRQIFKAYPAAVLEHHSAVAADLDPADESTDKHNLLRLTAENWNAPLIVTTTVQLFESLFSARPGRCRKLHNLCDSIIILDEVQQLPRPYHAPIISVMRDLADFFGVTWLLCTATQPALGTECDPFGRLLKTGLPKPHELISNPLSLANKLRRVKVNIDLQPSSLKVIADRAAAEDCVLCIVNTRSKAADLFNLLPKSDDNLHLSANMCPAHRSEVIQLIKQRLKERVQGIIRPLRVISTQLVEAGVDIDFPVVMRELSGLDALAQAAGRCNRNGLLPQLGRFEVFTLEGKQPPGHLTCCADTAQELLKTKPELDILSPKAVQQYFALLNSKESADEHHILDRLSPKGLSSNTFDIPFRSIAADFHLIDDSEQITIIVPYKTPEQERSPIYFLLAQLESGSLRQMRRASRILQRYAVNITPNAAKALEKYGSLEIRTGVFVLSVGYDQHLGLIQPGEFLPETVI